MDSIKAGLIKARDASHIDAPIGERQAAVLIFHTFHTFLTFHKI